VVLTGDGADELFFGYGRYARFLELKTFKTKHKKITEIVHLFSKSLLNFHLVPRGRLLRIIRASENNQDIDTYLSLVGFSHYEPSSNSILFQKVLTELKAQLVEYADFRHPINGLRNLDVATYLANDILTKVDRAAMAFSLETRAPFLDRRVAQFAMTTSEECLFDGSQKIILRDLLSSFVSTEIFDRQKMGFGAPLGEWLRTTLSPWALGLIKNFDWESVGVQQNYPLQLWDELNESRGSEATYLWILLSLAASCERYK
jgi:asparagine synthase (glutamine-hydrolysing)